ncbi:hypothetical protein TOPH_01243 [Tolypocladium ophioglossoides CBS 100239]|uniref:Uncharacterized protein n=1 Tax=Tolypocladium ophioglossoides (strain CBS 100239) TaxID=1163406 RepID=A0A0L0NIS5_TOLOC|nr:hypothetical protein TOPH_01243 [Tolypocladium ophioglossoides CBS 100239]
MADPKPITLNLPSKYSSRSASPMASSPAPPTEWLIGTWTVTHSTLSMWCSVRNVRITYKLLPPKSDGRLRIDDLVEYEPTGKTGVRKTVAGVDTQSTADGAGGWDWRGKGWLFFVGSHWEVLGWGEEARTDGGRERWAVTWFAPTVFTKEGVDVYCDRREGLSEQTYKKVEEALRGMEAREVAGMVKEKMRVVEIKLPWTEE